MLRLESSGFLTVQFENGRSIDGQEDKEDGRQKGGGSKRLTERTRMDRNIGREREEECGRYNGGEIAVKANDWQSRWDERGKSLGGK